MTYCIAPEYDLGFCNTILEHLYPILCDFLRDLVHFVNWLPEQKKQESCAIAKMTAQCAIYMGALKIFGTP